MVLLLLFDVTVSVPVASVLVAEDAGMPDDLETAELLWQTTLHTVHPACVEQT